MDGVLNYRDDCSTHKTEIECSILPFFSRTYRWAAYRHFTLWARGRLGRRVRRIIPSCVINLIRQHYPSGDGHYHGFEFAEPEMLL